MANIKSAVKRARQSVTRNQLNSSQRSYFRTQIKNVLKAVQEGKKPEAQQAFIKMQSALDKAVKVGLIHKNKAARHKSRLSAKVKAIAA